MKKFIEVYDNMLDPKLMDFIEHLVSNGNNIPYLYRANLANLNQKDYSFPGFAHVFHPQPSLYYPTSFFSFLQILYSFSNRINLIIKQIMQGRVFLTLPTNSNILSSIHTDDNEFHLVCLYYVNDSDGDTIFYEDDKVTERKRVSPKKGRIAFFHGGIPHCASSPTTNPRFIVNFNFLSE